MIFITPHILKPDVVSETGEAGESGKTETEPSTSKSDESSSPETKEELPKDVEEGACKYVIQVASLKEKIGIRVPGSPTARLLLREIGPLTATSANVHGGDDPVTVEVARMQLGDNVAYYIEADDEVSGYPSTIVDHTSGQPKILREGAYPRERIEEWMRAL